VFVFDLRSGWWPLVPVLSVAWRVSASNTRQGSAPRTVTVGLAGRSPVPLSRRCCALATDEGPSPLRWHRIQTVKLIAGWRDSARPWRSRPRVDGS
jgi:hypothetical protein